MTTITLEYKEKYQSFLNDYHTGVTSGERVGFLIAELSNFFAEYNMLAGQQEKKLNQEAAKIVSGTDEVTGKPLSVAKADILIKATDQHADSKMTRIHLENIDGFLNSLKKLQLGILNEFSHMGNN